VINKFKAVGLQMYRIIGKGIALSVNKLECWPRDKVIKAKLYTLASHRQSMVAKTI